MAKQIWQIGIDEAGYGPYLGPLVMTVVGCRGPNGDLWKLLRRAVRRASDEDDGRPVVADSKAVHVAGKGVGPLEKSVAPFLRTAEDAEDRSTSLSGLVEKLAFACLAQLHEECWFTGQTALPFETAEDEVAQTTARVRGAARKVGVRLGLVRSVIVCPPRFNALVDRWDSKAAVLGLGLADLISRCLELPGEDAFEIVVDKHGGRNAYSALVQHAFADGFVLAREEGAERSVYDVCGLSRQVRVTFMPRAEEASFSVALASMVSKYLREVLMVEFNQFWMSHVSGLKPTAGYPGDAERFFEDIKPAVTKLGIPKEKLWRQR